MSTSSFWLRLVASYYQCLSQHCKLLSKLLSICHDDFSANFSLWFRLATIYHSVPNSALQVGDFSAVNVSLWFRLATIYHSVPISALQVGDFSAVNVSLWFRLATVYYLTTFSVYLSIETSVTVSISDFHSVGGSVCVCVQPSRPFTSFHCLKVKVQVSDVAAEFVQDSPDVGREILFCQHRQNLAQTRLVQDSADVGRERIFLSQHRQSLAQTRLVCLAAPQEARGQLTNEGFHILSLFESQSPGF